MKDRIKRWGFRLGLVAMFLMIAAPGGGKRLHG